MFLNVFEKEQLRMNMFHSWKETTMQYEIERFYHIRSLSLMYRDLSLQYNWQHTEHPKGYAFAEANFCKT